MTRGKTHGNIAEASLGFETKIWSMGDSLRGSLNSAECGSLMIGEGLCALCQRNRMIVHMCSEMPSLD